MEHRTGKRSDGNPLPQSGNTRQFCKNKSNIGRKFACECQHNQLYERPGEHSRVLQTMPYVT